MCATGRAPRSHAPANSAASTGTHHGFVTIAPNKRYLRYSDGTSFFGVGLWYNEVFFGGFRPGSSHRKRPRRPREPWHQFHQLLSVAAGNLCHGPGALRHGPLLRRLDELFQWCEQRDLADQLEPRVPYLSFGDRLGRPTQYQNNPYRTITSAKDFYGSEEAWKYQEKLYRYVIARWGYSRALFLWFVIDEINGTDGWVHGDHEVAEDWCRKMRDFFHAHDPYGRPTTGTQSGGFDNWWPEGYRIFDVAGREIYEAQGHPMPPSGKPDPNDDHPLRYSLPELRQTGSGSVERLRKAGDHRRDAAGTTPTTSPARPDTWRCTTTRSGRRWPTACVRRRSGGPIRAASTKACSRANCVRTADFVRDIDFAAAEWQPTKVEVSAGDGWAMKSDELIFGWVVNPKSGVANESFTLAGLDDGEYDVRLYRTWSGRELEPESVAMEDGKLTVKIPELQPQDSHANNIGDDVAFKIV